MNEVFESMDEVLRGVLERLERDGEWVSPRGRRTKEVTGLSFALSDPRARRIGNPARRWSEAYAVGELCWHLSGSDRAEEISYYSSVWRSLSADGETIAGSCYGKRIFGAVGGESAWSAARQLLVEDPCTRRAILHLVPADHPKANELDVPCIATIQFLSRKGRLDCYATMRSCDAILGLCYDVYFVTMLQEMMSVEVGLELGGYHQSTASMHYYERHSGLVRRILGARPACARPMPRMDGVDGVEELLRVERLVREQNMVEVESALAVVPRYWRRLGAVLVDMSASRAAATGRVFKTEASS